MKQPPVPHHRRAAAVARLLLLLTALAAATCADNPGTPYYRPPPYPVERGPVPVPPPPPTPPPLAPWPNDPFAETTWTGYMDFGRSGRFAMEATIIRRGDEASLYGTVAGQEFPALRGTIEDRTFNCRLCGERWSYPPPLPSWQRVSIERIRIDFSRAEWTELAEYTVVDDDGNERTEQVYVAAFLERERP